MRKTMVVGVVPVALAVAIAGCGGSSASSPAGGSTTSAASSAGPVALITTKHAKLGTILAYGPKKLTVYLFEADKANSTSCTGACTAVWPPVTGKPRVGPGASSSDLGTIRRPDGTMQVTYNGHPLYLYAKDKDDGDTYGQGIKSFGAAWYVLKPSGEKLDPS